MINLKTASINKNNIKKVVESYNCAVQVISSFPTGIFKYRTHFKETPWVDFIANELEKYGLETNRYITKTKPKDFKGRIVKGSDQWGFESKGSVEFAKIYHEWYFGENHIKCIPRTLTQITPNILLAWYVGDGSLNAGFAVNLHTHSFSKQDNQYLVSLLRKCGIHSRVVQGGLNSKGKFWFYLSVGGKKHVDLFLNYLDNANPVALNLVKSLLPWKFDKDVKYKNFKHLFK